MVLINPDNPSGNYLPQAEVLRLLAWCAKQKIKLILDESFVDFADEIDATLLKTEVLEQYNNLILIKSISKSYGVPGLRLGIMATADQELMQNVRAHLPIWNINAFAEFYLQISEKYHSDYEVALQRFRAERADFAKKLGRIKGVKVFPSQANYFLVKIDGLSVTKLAAKLLTKHNIFIKDPSSKLNRSDLCRIAIRNHEDNQQLIAALTSILERK